MNSLLHVRQSIFTLVVIISLLTVKLEAQTGAVATRTGANGAAVAASPIAYHGGPIIPTPHVYIVWYGNWSGNTALSILPDFITGLSASPYFNIDGTYSQGGGDSVSSNLTLGPQVFDSYSEGTLLTDSSLQTVVSRQLTAGSLPTDPNGVYFVLTSADVDQKGSLGEFCVQFCGFHNHASLNGADIKYAFVGNIDRCPATCSASNLGVGPNGNSGADAMANVMAHELNETVTDPDLNAWFDGNGQEVGDKCNFTFGPEFSAPNGAPADITLGSRDFLIQENWLNVGAGQCAMAYSPVGGSGTEHLFHLDSAQHIRELWLDKGGIWHTNDIIDFTQSVNASPAGSVVSFSNGSTEDVFYVGTDLHVHQLLFNSGWTTSDVTALSGAPSVSGNAMAGYLFQGNPQVFHVGTDQHIHRLWFNGTWHNDDVTALSGAPSAVTGSAVSGYIFNGSQLVTFIGSDQHAHKIFFTSKWFTDDLTAESHAPNVVSGSDLGGYQFNSSAAFFYMAADQHFHKVFWNGSAWFNDDVTVESGAPAAVLGSKLRGYQFNSSALFYDIAADQHVHKMFWNGSTWFTDDMTVESGAPPAVSGSDLTGFAAGSLANFYFLAADNHVHRMWWNGTSWQTSDVTAAAGAPNVASGSALSGFLWP